MFVINRVSEDGKTVQNLKESGNIFSPDIVETLRLDWKPEDREKFYVEKWERCLDRSDESMKDQNDATENCFDLFRSVCEVKVAVLNNKWESDLEVFNVELKKGDDINDLSIKIANKSLHLDHSKMMLSTVGDHQCTWIFDSPTEELSKETFRDETIVAYQILRQDGWNRRGFLAVNLFDLGTQEYFGVPVLIEKPTERIGYDELQKKLENVLSKFLTKKSERSFGKKLDRWWSTRSNPDVVDVDAGKVEGVSFDVHKLVLIARSEIFEAMLTSPETRESKTNELVIPDIQPRIVKELLQFIYCDNCDNLKENALELFAAADKYILDRLKTLAFNEICRKRLPKLRHVIRLVEFGIFYNSEKIVEHAIKQILLSYPAIIKMTEWETFITTEPKVAFKLYKKLGPRLSNCLF
jgi:hypothetical protein